MNLTTLSNQLLLAGLGLLMAPLAAATCQVVRGYLPPTQDEPSEQRTETYGSRGCQNSSAKLNVLVPFDHIATTSSSHPTILLYLSGIPDLPVLVSITEPGVAQSIFEQSLTVERRGIIPVTVPEESPGLEKGKTYILTAGILCHPNRRSQSAYTRISLKRVANSQALERQLADAATVQERAQIYAQAGIWYDALALCYGAYSSQPHSEQIARYFQLLLEQAGFNTARLGLKVIW